MLVQGLAGTGFGGTPFPKEKAEAAVAALPQKFFYKQVISHNSVSQSVSQGKPFKMCTCLKISPFIQKKKKIPAGLKPLEVSLALTESAKVIGLESSRAARHLTNFIKRYFSRE